MNNKKTTNSKPKNGAARGQSTAPCYTKYDIIVNNWNNQSDSFNQWDNLSIVEQVEFAVKETARRCKEIAQQRYLAKDQAINIDAKISNEFGV